ncbi:nuclear transport factor 2 family protein [Chitinophaga silvatica]|uniref:Nuclear transport factor 2 family protein n=1 Tax=Chitinophaga silvatica TaxID=2282649 RepID=A0A3E1YGX7_9BACT|nr:nuclear transport factor 2 family protein [Chitinophaga silvatica]RFS26618.1 nuclear transport factor 2 family protein [Chitinophaga silvatica]
MEQQSLSVVTEFIEAVKSLNLEKVGSLLHPEVIWEQPGTNRFSGLKQSSNEVFQMVGGMFEVSQNTMTLAQVKSYAVNNNQVAVSMVWKAERPGAALNSENIDLYTVKNGQIVAVTVFATDIQQENNFWGN